MRASQNRRPVCRSRSQVPLCAACWARSSRSLGADIRRHRMDLALHLPPLSAERPDDREEQQVDQQAPPAIRVGRLLRVAVSKDSVLWKRAFQMRPDKGSAYLR